MKTAPARLLSCLSALSLAALSLAALSLAACMPAEEAPAPSPAGPAPDAALASQAEGAPDTTPDTTPETSPETDLDTATDALAPAGQTAAEDECALDVSVPWTPPGSAYTLNATTSCENGQILVDRRIIDADGNEIFLSTYFPDQVMTLAWIEADGVTLESALALWLEPDSWRPHTGELPDYNDPAEFPFMPSLTEADYEAARAAEHPMLCYVQGMESQLCLAVIDGEIVEMGVQRFPG